MEEKQVNSLKIGSGKLLFVVGCSAFVLGSIFSGMGTTIYFLTSQNKSAAAAEAKVPQAVQYPALPEGSPQMQAMQASGDVGAYPPQLAPGSQTGQLPNQTEAQAKHNDLLEMLKTQDATVTPELVSDEVGLSGGGFFLGDKKIPYAIPLEDNKDAEKAKKILLEKLIAMPSLKVGNGNNPVYVLFDPICPICHESWKTQISEDWAKKYNLTIHWIPVNYFFQQKESSIASIYILSLIANNKQNEAFEFFNNMNLMAGTKPIPINNQKEILEEVIGHLNAGTMAMIQTGQRLPTVLIPSANGKAITAISGLLEGFEIKEALVKQ